MNENEHIDLISLMEDCIYLGVESGNLIRSIFNTEKLETIAKDKDGNVLNQRVSLQQIMEGRDAVTQADLRTQMLIEGSLKSFYPGLVVIGEEDIDPKDYKVIEKKKRDSSKPTKYVPLSSVRVYVDPIDGTKEFVLGNEICATVLIGISVGEVAYGGVIHQPFDGPNGRTIWSLLDYGADDSSDCSEKNVFIRNSFTGLQTITITSKKVFSEPANEFIKMLGSDVVLKVGGAGYKVLHLLEGLGDVYAFPMPGTKKWDTCAPEAILKYFGGKMTDIHGNSINYADVENLSNSNGVLASRRAETHSHYIDKVSGCNGTVLLF